VAVWLVEAKAVRIGNSAWAPLFEAVVSPNSFTAAVELAQVSGPRRLAREDFEKLFNPKEGLEAANDLLEWWKGPARSFRIMARPAQAVLMTRGPGVGGWSSVIGIYPNGQVAVPFGSYNGQNSGLPISALGTVEFRSRADEFFGFDGTEIQAKTSPGWLTLDRLEGLKDFCTLIAEAYLEEKAVMDAATEEYEASKIDGNA
jgi:hypothetical protein